MNRRAAIPLIGAAAILAAAMMLAPLLGVVSAQEPAADKPTVKPRSRELLTTDNHTITLDLPGIESVRLERDAEGNVYYVVATNDDGDQRYSPQAFAELLLKHRPPKALWQRVMNVSSWTGIVWVFVGLVGQVLFTGRMVVQWIVSEKHGRSIVPPSFWWMSLIGASMLLAYFTWRKDIVGFIGQATGWLIYVRNLYLIYALPKPEPEVYGEMLDPRGPEAQREANE